VRYETACHAGGREIESRRPRQQQRGVAADWLLQPFFFLKIFICFMLPLILDIPHGISRDQNQFCP